MFCSKCGKEINDGAAFCDKCGNPVGNSSSNNNADNSTSERNVLSNEISTFVEKEKNEKKMAIICAVICNIIAIMFASTLFNSVDMLFEGPRVERLQELISEEFNGAEMWLILPAIADIGVYIYAYLNRKFEKTFGGVVSTAVIYALIHLFIAFMSLAIFNEDFGANEYTLTFGFWLIYIVFLCIDIYRVIAYKKASEAEEAAVYYEKKDSLKGLRCLSDEKDVVTDWKCRHCGSTNKLGQDYCKDCGKYR